MSNKKGNAEEVEMSNKGRIVEIRGNVGKRENVEISGNVKKRGNVQNRENV